MSQLLHVVWLAESQVIDVSELVLELEKGLNHHQANADSHVECESGEVDALERKIDFYFEAELNVDCNIRS